ncbi:hypothetical protein MRB53_024833 [Persea americana]|uniref:Uncharacterized protein n=1 Tax=Persea americana TaxID=3435 RepID=A0ACC2LDU9_PERAE|nr:hypothetical protein MRB53_024833 [Persea americana]
MDSSSSPFQPWHLLFFFLSLLVFFFTAMKRKRRRYPPGPRGLPIIGNMLMINQLTHRGLARLSRRYGGIVYLRLGSLHAIDVSTPEMARQILQVQDNIFSNRPATIAIRYLTYDRADMVFAQYGPFWRQTRKLCVMKLFSRRRAESWASVRNEVEATLRSIAGRAGSPVSIGELVFGLTSNMIYRAAFGLSPRQGLVEFASILNEFSKLFMAFNMADFIPWMGWLDPLGLKKRMERARKSLDRFIDSIIDDHAAKKRVGHGGEDDTDMVDDLLAYLDDGGDGNIKGMGREDDLQTSLKLTRDNIKAIIMDVMFGGTETIAMTIEWAMAELMKCPEELSKVQEELAQVVGLNRKVHENDLDNLPHLKCTIKETMRLHPPIPLLLHEATEDAEIAGYFIPAGTRVTVNAWMIGRDKSAWVDPDNYRPDRFLKDGSVDLKGNHFELIPFGSGRRSCPGMQLGLYTVELTLAQLLHCFNWALPNGMKTSELDMRDEFGLTVPKAVHLVAIPTPRLHCPVF